MGTSVRSTPSLVVREQRGAPQITMADLTPKDVERAKFAFDIYDFEGKSRMDMFYLGDCLRGLNLNPTLKMIDKLGGAKKKGEKFIKLEEFYPIYSDVKKSKETGNFEDFIECLKLYDKMENGTMMLGELEHILLSLGEKLEREEVDILIKECCDPEDDDGFIPYEPFLGGCVRAPTPRCTRIGKVSPTTGLDKQPVRAATLCENNIQLSTTAGCINNYTNQKTKLSEPSKKDADRSRLLLISKICYVSTFKSGF